jgi:hypothetical protein
MYGKFFSSAFTGSMVGSGPLIFSVWGYVIASAHRDGTVEINPTLLAAMIGKCSPEEVADAVNSLCLPDANSRSKAEEGRRLVREGQFLYRIVNFGTYHAIRDEDQRKVYMREYMRKRRASETDPVNSAVNTCKPRLAHTDADADTDKVASLRDAPDRANASVDPDCGFSEEELAALNQAAVPDPPLLTCEDEKAPAKGFPWPQVHAIFKRVVPEVGIRENAPARDSAMKLFWRRNNKSAAAFELLAEKVRESDYLMARNGHTGRGGKPYPWAWIFDKDAKGITRANRVLDGEFANDRMAFVLEKAAKAKLTKVMLSSAAEPVEVDLSETVNGEPRYKLYDRHPNGYPNAIDYAA